MPLWCPKGKKASLFECSNMDGATNMTLAVGEDSELKGQSINMHTYLLTYYSGEQDKSLEQTILPRLAWLDLTTTA
jgi:hypothetical protein